MRRSVLPWTWITGLLGLALVVLLFLSGAVMTLYYSPTPGVAYDSVDHAQFDVPFGTVVRGIHVYAWNLLLVVLGLHLATAFIVGAYKAPWQAVWISGVLVVLVIPLFIVTGDLLPWNQSGYWATKVRLGIAASVPMAGDFAVSLLGANPHIGIVTLTRFYVLHILFLPCAFLLAVAVHAYCIGRAIRASRAPDGIFAPDYRTAWPHHVTRWLALFLVVAVLLGAAAWWQPAPLGDPADPTDTAYVPRPEWWVLPLNQLVTTLNGPWTVFATVVIPGGLVSLLLALPFLDRSPERHPARRKTVMFAAAVMGAAILGLSVMSYVAHYLPGQGRQSQIGSFLSVVARR
jgi:ubiquinol-cytochrome c reductase cytochrome b subunit